MKLGKLPWMRAALILGIGFWAYHEFTKEPTVYQPMSVIQAYASADTLEGHHLRITGIPSPASYARVSNDKAALSFVLSDDNGDHITCYAQGKVDSRNMYLQTKASLDHISDNSDTTKVSLDGKMKDDYFEFILPKNLDDILTK